MTIWNAAAASVAVWRLSWLLCGERRETGRQEDGGPRPGGSAAGENLIGDRAVDLLCWLSIWLSAQTAIWVAGGLTGVLLCLFAQSRISRYFMRDNGGASEQPPFFEGPVKLRPETPDGEFSCRSLETPFRALETTLRGNHG